MNHFLVTIALSASYATTPCHSFNLGISSAAVKGSVTNAYALSHSQYTSGKHSIYHRRSGPIKSRLYLFDSLLKKSDATSSSNSTKGRSQYGISQEELDFLESGFGLEENTTPPFPYSIDLPTSNRASRLVIRHLEDEDITKILPEVVREFGALIQQVSTTPEPGDELATKIENYLFSLTVLIGLTQRVVRREKGYDANNSACPDHDVICLVEQTPNNDDSNGNAETTSYSEKIVGMAELSWQPPNPNSNAPPFVLPFFVKSLISRYGPSRDGTSSEVPAGYISNVLVWKTRRGRGYGRVLMAALEGIAKLWDCEDVRLHVDANEYSGRIARGLYWSLGYEGVPDRGGTSKGNELGYAWMGPSMANQGLYLVDGVPLLYLRKVLKDQ